MRGLTLAGQANQSEPSGTKVGQFLATRGVILIKEIKEIGTLAGEYGIELQAKTIILRTARSSTRVDDKTFGIKLIILKRGEETDTAVLDFDESQEFCNAIQFIHEASQKISNQKTDYIETSFSTKDKINVGFYQETNRNQLAFLTLGPVSEHCFLRTHLLPSLKQLIELAREHLIKKGAEL